MVGLFENFELVFIEFLVDFGPFKAGLFDYLNGAGHIRFFVLT